MGRRKKFCSTRLNFKVVAKKQCVEPFEKGPNVVQLQGERSAAALLPLATDNRIYSIFWHKNNASGKNTQRVPQHTGGIRGSEHRLNEADVLQGGVFQRAHVAYNN